MNLKPSAAQGSITEVPPAVMTGTLYHFHEDYIGRPYMITSPKPTSGNPWISWYAEYSPFGEVVYEAGNIIIGNPALTGIFYQPAFRFPGQYEDEETGFVYNWNRYYIPWIGRYNRIDPMLTAEEGFSGNPYNYVLNPLLWADFTGLYGKDQHYDYIVKEYPRNHLFRCNNLKTIAEADNAVDYSSKFDKCKYHFNDNPSVDFSNDLYNSCNPVKFGQALHAVQDHFAHRDPRKKGGPFDCKLFWSHPHWGIGGKDPDDFTSGNPADMDMQQAVNDLLNEFDERCCDCKGNRDIRENNYLRSGGICR